MNRTLACVAAVVSMSFAFLPGFGRCQEAQKGVPAVKAQPAPKAKQLPAGRTLEGKGYSIDNKLPSTGAAQRDVVNADFTIVGAGGSIPSGIIENNDVAHSAEKDSLIMISGWVHMGDMEYGNVLPEFPNSIRAVFPDLPQTCTAFESRFNQHQSSRMRYKQFYHFKDTATKPECWRYFTSLDRLRLEIRKVRHIPKSWATPGYADIVGAGVMEYPLSPVRPKVPGN